MISGGLTALVLVSAFQAPVGPGGAEHLPAEPRQQLTPALLQLRAGVSAANGADLNAQLRGKCKTNCKQDKEIGKLKGNAAKGVKAFDRLAMVAKEIDEILTANDKVLETSTDKLTAAIGQSKKDWEEVDEELRIRIKDYKDQHGIKFASANKEVDKTVQTVAAFFTHMKGKFVDMKDLIQVNKASVEDYLKVEAAKSGKAVTTLGAAVADMRAQLQETMGQTRGLLSQKIKDASTLNVGRVNAADESVTQSVEKIEAKMGEDRTEQADAAKMLKQLKKTIDGIDKSASSLATKERKNADKLLGSRMDELNSQIKSLQSTASAKKTELEGVLKDVKTQVTTATTALAQNNAAAVSQASDIMTGKSDELTDQMKEQQKKVFDELIANGLDAENMVHAVKYLSEYGDRELEKLKNSADELRMDDAEAMRGLTTSWSDEYNDNRREFDKTSQEVVGDVRANMKGLDSMSLETQTQLAEKLDELATQVDFTNQDFEDGFDKLKATSLQGFNANTDDLDRFYAEFSGMGVQADKLAAETKSMIDTTEDNTRTASTLADKYTRSFSRGLKDAMKAEAAELNADSRALQDKMDADSAANKQHFLNGLSAVEAQSDTAMAASASELGSLSQKFSSRQAEVSGKMKMNRNAEDKQFGKVHDLDEAAAATADDMAADMSALQRSMQNTKVASSSALAARLAGVKAGLEGSIGAQQQVQERAVNGFVEGSKAGMQREEGELRSLEGNMLSGSDRFKSQVDQSQAELRGLTSEARALSAQVSADFKQASAALHNQQVQAGMVTDSVRELMQQKADALDKLGQDRISQLGTEQQEEFNQAVELRKKRIAEIMAQGDTMTNDMAKQIEAAEADFSTKLHSLEGEALGMTGDVEAMTQHEREQALRIEAAVRNAHDSERATKLLVEEDKDKQAKMLADAREKVIDEIKKKTGNLDHDLEEQMRAKMEAADARIQRILDNEELEYSEQQRQIEEIDSGTREEIKRLAMQQVQLDSQLMTFETDQSQQSGHIDLQLKALGGQLKDEQVDWLRGVLESKEELRQITESLTAEVDKLLKLFELEDHEMAAKVEEAKASAKAKLASVGGQLAALSEKHGYVADEAIKMADLAEKAVMAEQHQVSDEISDTQKDMTVAGAALHESDEETGSELAGERDARLAAMKNEREETTELIHGLLDKISEAAHMMSGSAVASGDKQRALERKLRSIRTVLEESRVEQLSQLQLADLSGLARPHAYLEQRASSSGLAAQRERIRALSSRATSHLAAEARQDAVLHRDLQALGTKVSAGDTELFRLRNRVESQLSAVARDDDEQLREATTEMRALKRQVTAPDFVEAPKEPQLAQARLQQLEEQVVANEARTQKYERENALMRSKLEAAVKKELSRQLA